MFSSLGLAFSYPPRKNFAPVVTTIYQVPTLCQVQSYMISDPHGNPARSAFSSRGINKGIESGGLRGLPAWRSMGGKPVCLALPTYRWAHPHGSECSALSGSTGKRKRVFLYLTFVTRGILHSHQISPEIWKSPISILFLLASPICPKTNIKI